MYYASPIVPWMVWVLETRPFLWGPGSAPSPIDPGDEPLLHPTALRAPAAGGAAAARAANDGSHHVRRPGERQGSATGGRCRAVLGVRDDDGASDIPGLSATQVCGELCVSFQPRH